MKSFVPDADKQPVCDRLDRLRDLLATRDLAGFVVLDRHNTLYLSGFQCSNSVIVIGQDRCVFLTDFRYIESATDRLSGLFDVRQMKQDGLAELSQAVRELPGGAIGYENSISVVQLHTLQKATSRRKLVDASDLPLGLRLIKDEHEVRVIARNQALTQKVLSAVVNESTRAGRTELDLNMAVKRQMLDRQVAEAFDTIVATGPNTSLPHAVSSKRRARAGEYVLFDLGVKSAAYNSDMTRTLVLGKANQRQRDIYKIVLEAQLAALSVLKPGMPCRDVDAVAREVIRKAGYGEFFGHGLGHGVGLEIHEGPRLNPASAVILQENMVVTVEPGIYVPGFGGVRIEDLVVITRDGHKNLTTASKRLRELR